MYIEIGMTITNYKVKENQISKVKKKNEVKMIIKRRNPKGQVNFEILGKYTIQKEKETCSSKSNGKLIFGVERNITFLN